MPSVSTSEVEGLRAWAALLRCHAAVVPVLSRQVQQQSGLPLSWYDVLLELQAASEGRLRIQELGERVVLSRSRVSRLVDELAREGLVVREPDPSDGRASFASITDEGLTAFRRAAPIYLDAIGQHFSAHLTANERRAIIRGLERVTATGA
jgi:DNA-binding MarR family transcriptional regulator